MIENLIETGKYQQALDMLNDMNDENVRYQRLVCLIGMENYTQARNEALIAKMQATNTYYDVVSIYITALKQLQKYEEAIDVLIEELSMPYIPYEYESLFNAAYDEILLDKQDYNDQTNNTIFNIDQIEKIILGNTNEDLLYMALDQLQSLNVRKILPAVRQFLTNDSTHPFAKTLLLEIMIDQQVDDEFEVVKFDKTYYFNPSYMPLVLNQESYALIDEHLSRVIEDDNPSLYLQCREYLEYVLYCIYPEELIDVEEAVVAAAIHYYVATLQYLDCDLDELETNYYVDKIDVEHQLLALKQLE